MTVYADVLFLVNFSLDYVSLYLTSRLMSLPTRTWRLCVGAAVGAVYAVCALFWQTPEAVYIAATLESNAEQAEIVQYICDNTQSDEQIQVIGNQCSIYLQSGRKAASGIFYLPSADLKKAGILKKLRRDIDREAPRLLVTESGSYVSFIDRLKPDYELVKSTEKFSIYRKKG